MSIPGFGVCTAAFVAVFVGGSGIAHAGRSSSMAATCTVGDPAIQGNLYTIASGSVRHKAGKIGTITLYCPISPTITLGGGPFGGWFMYVRINLFRADTNALPIFYGVAVDSIPY